MRRTNTPALSAQTQDAKLQGMKENGGSHDPEDIVGVYHHLLDNDFRIKETWFLRQLSADEVETKVPMQSAPHCMQHVMY